MTVNYVDLPLATYLADAASAKPAPGCGSVAALVGALATTMGTMSANFTIGRKKYAAVDVQVREQLEQLGAQHDAFLQLMHRDMEAYAGVLAAYKLPHSDDAETAARGAAIQRAVREAMAVPLATAETAVRTLRSAAALGPIANANLLSDVAVAAVLAAAVFDCGRINVEVNLTLCEDAELAARVRQSLDALGEECVRLKQECLAGIAGRQQV